MIVKKHLKYKVGDRVFHKELGWGAVKGVTSQALLRYAVEFDEEFDGAYGCDGLCNEERGSYVFERNLLGSDSFLNYLYHDIKQEFGDAKSVLRKLTLWGKFLYIVFGTLYVPLVMWGALKTKYEHSVDKVIYKIIHIFRIYKE